MPSPTDLVNPSIEFSEELISATRNFARSKPWRGSVDLRIAKFREFHEVICGSAGPALLVDVPDPETNSGDSRFNQDMNAIELHGKLSVLTYLFLYFMAQAVEDVQSGSFDNIEPMVKAMTLFSRVFPQSFARLRMENGMFTSVHLHRDASRPVQAPSSVGEGTVEENGVLPPQAEPRDVNPQDPTLTEAERDEWEL